MLRYQPLLFFDILTAAVRIRVWISLLGSFCTCALQYIPLRFWISSESEFGFPQNQSLDFFAWQLLHVRPYIPLRAFLRDDGRARVRWTTLSNCDGCAAPSQQPSCKWLISSSCRGAKAVNWFSSSTLTSSPNWPSMHALDSGPNLA